MTRTECYLTLNSIRQIGPIRVRRMLEVLGSVEAILAAPASKLATIDGMTKASVESLSKWQENWNLEKELQKIEELGLKVIDCEDPEYPARLKEIYDPPLVLYYRGSLEAITRRSLAIVGSRHTTNYGFETARKLAFQCAASGLTVVSGLARGIDTAAHQGAVAAKGRTVAVLGSSVDLLYPEENRPLAEKIVETGGAIVSEFSLGTPPDTYTFPMRNRIASGLSEGVLVIEAGADSGALITAKMALEQGRQVFAVPGRIDSPHNKGCHRLIKEGAKLVEEVEDVLAEFEYLFPKKELFSDTSHLENLDPQELAVYQGLGDDEAHIDVITRKCGLQPSQVSSSLLRLELKKLIRQLPGKYYVKTR